ncbi:unnamed protein product, partial [Ectocarpus sp. 8 AP-2014]
MVNVTGKRCAHGGCTTNASFGVAGTKIRLYCAEHAKHDMVKVSAKERAHADGCPTVPCWGDREDAAGPKYCAKHRGDLTGPNSISFTRACAPAGAEGCQRTCTWASRYGGQPTLCDIHGRLRAGDVASRVVPRSPLASLLGRGDGHHRRGERAPRRGWKQEGPQGGTPPPSGELVRGRVGRR